MRFLIAGATLLLAGCASSSSGSASHPSPAAQSSPISAAPISSPTSALSLEARQLDAATPTFRACLSQGGGACTNAVFVLDELGGGAIPPVGSNPTITADAEAAHSYARQMLDAFSPAQITSVAPKFRSAVDKLRADYGLGPLPL